MATARKSRGKRARKTAAVPAVPAVPVTPGLGYDPTAPLEPRTIRKVKEGVTEVTLDDGSVLSVKQVVVDVKRVKDQWNQQGEPIYVVQAVGLIGTKSVPKRLKRKQS